MDAPCKWVPRAFCAWLLFAAVGSAAGSAAAAGAAAAAADADGTEDACRGSDPMSDASAILQLANSFGNARLTGSGSTVAGLANLKEASGAKEPTGHAEVSELEAAAGAQSRRVPLILRILADARANLLATEGDHGNSTANATASASSSAELGGNSTANATANGSSAMLLQTAGVEPDQGMSGSMMLWFVLCLMILFSSILVALLVDYPSEPEDRQPDRYKHDTGEWACPKSDIRLFHPPAMSGKFLNQVDLPWTFPIAPFQAGGSGKAEVIGGDSSQKLLEVVSLPRGNEVSQTCVLEIREIIKEGDKQGQTKCVASIDADFIVHTEGGRLMGTMEPSRGGYFFREATRDFRIESQWRMDASSGALIINWAEHRHRRGSVPQRARPSVIIGTAECKQLGGEGTTGARAASCHDGLHISVSTAPGVDTLLALTCCLGIVAFAPKHELHIDAKEGCAVPGDPTPSTSSRGTRTSARSPISFWDRISA